MLLTTLAISPLFSFEPYLLIFNNACNFHETTSIVMCTQFSDGLRHDWPISNPRALRMYILNKKSYITESLLLFYQ